MLGVGRGEISSHLILPLAGGPDRGLSLLGSELLWLLRELKAPSAGLDARTLTNEKISKAGKAFIRENLRSEKRVMSAAAPAVARPRVVSKGWVKVPSSLIENQASLTHAEFSLALVVLRRAGGRENTPVTISDDNWRNWTGLSPRLKEYAIAGLKQKCVSVVGRGEDARFAFHPAKWNHFVRTSGAGQKARTLGRKEGVKPKPGTMVHPECASKGCAMLPRETCEIVMFPTPDAQPVAQTEIAKGPAGEPPAGPVSYELTLGDGTTLEVSSPLPAASNAQPVARTEETPWPVTLQTVRKYFPIVGAEFVALLASTVKTSYPAFASVKDDELAGAVQVAYAFKRQYQKSEGLFLATVPAALKMLRSKPLLPTGRTESGAVDLIGEHMEIVARRIEAGDSRFRSFAERARALKGLAYDKIDAALDAFDADLTSEAWAALNPAQRFSIVGKVDKEVSKRTALSPDQASDMKRRLTRRESFDMLRLPSIYC